ncbi:MAG: MBL fold metallo-hydrolase [Pseudolabrys sp.]
MQLTIIGSGDAFGSGGRGNTCFHLRTAKGVLLVDCGASALPRLKHYEVDLNAIDGIVLSHLHGDHFGGLPFLLLDAQFLTRRNRPLLIAGPPGTRERLTAAMEVFFPRSSGSTWKFSWEVMEIALATPTDVLGHRVTTAEVIHQSGAPSTALRIEDGDKVFAYSGDTEWTDALLPIARGADLFICECYAYAGKLTGHMTWETLSPRLADLQARQVMLTHMNPTMLARIDEVRAAGVLIADDGLALAF